jgi:LysM repeat protein
MTTMRLLPIVALLIALTACDNSRWAPGYLVSEDGETMSNNDENKRTLTIRTMVSQLDQALGQHWRTEISIAELPKFERGADDDRTASSTSGWVWPKATVAVTLVGDGAGEPAISDAEITKAITDYLYKQVDRPSRNLTVAITRVVDAARFAAKPTKPTEVPTVTKPATTPGAKRYVVQTGDTWAELSQAFYGSAQHWRHLAEANQNSVLTPGQEIVIPPKP